MAVVVQPPTVAPPDIRSIVTPVLSALPGAAASAQPATTVLPSLTPILRQRVQLLASASTEPWIRLLTYEPSKVAQLTGIAQSGVLDPHPVSGEIEVDWDGEVDTQYKRVDQETLHTLAVLRELGLFFKLLYCTADPDGGDDGWLVGEVGVADASLLNTFAGSSDINQAEAAFQAKKTTSIPRPVVQAINGWTSQAPADEEEDDDDGYWARYDATPSRTPAAQRSPAPPSVAPTSQPDIQRSESTEAEDAYYAQYDSVQPAMDNHDPDEEVHMQELTRPLPPLGLAAHPAAPTTTTTAPKETTSGPVLAQPIPIKPGSERSSVSLGSDNETWVMAHPRPASSASSAGSQTVAKLEEVAETRQQTEYGVKQHISRSIRSLFLLSRASGIDREEFERMVRTELDVLAMVEDEI
ncbi:hypothetical protein C8A05DRAFT_13315 [Staphylotrichum tortipilum]|uniref:Uncharacterized protein n=1 Tax=Staphylotrichum tortipilum TaxID=2831512 RepID=A0AAN6MRV3_9PEZI|nr:hypothetical protein C8A05DRAFT_13315 [Staphylotrichum longicolle]